MKKIMLGTSDAWFMSRSSHRPSEPAYYIEDCRILCSTTYFILCSLSQKEIRGAVKKSRTTRTPLHPPRPQWVEIPFVRGMLDQFEQTSSDKFEQVWANLANFFCFSV